MYNNSIKKNILVTRSIINIKRYKKGKILTKILWIETEVKRFEDNFEDITSPILYYFYNCTRFCIRLWKKIWDRISTGLENLHENLCSKRKRYFNRYFTVAGKGGRPRWLSRKGAGVTGVPILVEQWPGHGELTNNHPLFMRQLRRFIHAPSSLRPPVYRQRDTCSITSMDEENCRGTFVSRN